MPDETDPTESEDEIPSIDLNKMYEKVYLFVQNNYGQDILAMIDVGKIAKQAEKLCSNARENRDAISSPPSPSANITDSAAAGTNNYGADYVLPLYNPYLLPPMYVGPIDSTAAVPAADPPSTVNSRTYDDSITTTASSRIYLIDDPPSADLPLTDSFRSNVNSTSTNPPSPN